MPVRTTLNYVDRSVPEPTIYYTDPPAGVPMSNVRHDPHEVEIVDCREAGRTFEIDRDGFAFVKLPATFTSFADDEMVRKFHYSEMVETAEQLLGRKVTAVLDHAMRLPAAGDRQRKSGTLRHPFHSTHCDYTPRSADQQVRRAMGEEAERWIDRPYAFINFWRPIRGPLRDDPLAVCAPDSVDQADLIRIRHIYDYDADSEVFGVAHNPAHRWYYMSDMQPDDAICFKLYDSSDARQRYVPHSAFTLPDPASPVLPRESFEIRLMVSYA